MTRAEQRMNVEILSRMVDDLDRMSYHPAIEDLKHRAYWVLKTLREDYDLRAAS